ncbi:Aste57867_21138 [Aphanomyces stellatus]|uniref:Aste57867_21138 protein n=1 Tax=Aphanomyces stellatus TaxID=120398 RepID=A0A485LI72_9STRA|nr:hypothetical protein As57867_021070 [Aphanomyces stellatus]VFT97812.1 Aste57867_21138 [Aphanomyces stellatus]
MSEVAPVFDLTMASGGSSNTGPQMIYYFVLYTTCMMLLVALVVFAAGAAARFRIDGLNLLVFHRVASLIWIGRPLLLLRGLTAFLMLSTAQIELVVDSVGYTRFALAPRSLLATMIVAGEATHASFEAPLASGLAWLVIVLLDTMSPIMLTAMLNRQYTTGDTDEYLYCLPKRRRPSWRVAPSSALTCLSSLAVAFAVRCMRRFFVSRRLMTASTNDFPLYLHGSAHEFLSRSPVDDKTHDHLDYAASTMSGLIPFSLHHQFSTLDMVLWLVRRSHESNHIRVSSVINIARRTSNAIQWTGDITTRRHFLHWPNVKLVRLVHCRLKVNFANDFYWASFNTTGHHVALATWFNQQMALARTLTTVQLDTQPSLVTTDINYSDPTLGVTSSRWYGVRLQFESLSAIRSSIQGLRKTDGCDASWIFSQYCWVDFQRRWSMANWAARQTRCEGTMYTNAAVYLEAVLRNVDPQSFQLLGRRL